MAVTFQQFNPDAYLSANQDLVDAGYTRDNVWDHYTKYGASEVAGGTRQLGYDVQAVTPSTNTIPQAAFNPTAYLQANPDVAQAHVDPYEHYIKYGQYEGRDLGFTAPVSISTHLADNVQNPQLPNNAEMVPQTIMTDPSQLINNSSTMITNAATMATPQTVATAPVTAGTATAYQTDLNQALAPLQGPANTYTATTVGAGNAEQMQAAQGAVSKEATVAGQLDKLYQEVEDSGGSPPWAITAVAGAEDMLASRGLGASSIGASALYQAVQDSAMNIAVRDAATYFQMDLTNLSNEQQARLVNVQNRQQALLSDTAAINAAKQFNASSVQQMQQFQSSLISQINEQNAARKTAIEQFNTSAKLQADTTTAELGLQAGMFNVTNAMAVDQFNATVENQRQQFNASMAFAIEQSNVNWRRQVATQDTAAINAANQLNVQNAFNMSAYSLNALWQSLRDEAQWAFTSSENAVDRDFRLAQAAVNFDYQMQLAEGQAAFQAGQGEGSLLGTLTDLIGLF